MGLESKLSQDDRQGIQENVIFHLGKRIDENNDKNMKSIKTALKVIVADALGEDPTRYIDTNRIPLICKAIFEIQLKMKLMLWVMGITSSAMIVGIVGLILKAI